MSENVDKSFLCKAWKFSYKISTRYPTIHQTFSAEGFILSYTVQQVRLLRFYIKVFFVIKRQTHNCFTAGL